LERITKAIIEAFIWNNELKLTPTQSRLCIPIINRIFKKMAAGITFSPIKTEGIVICDGHHRYIASVLANFPLERIPGQTTSATLITDWKSVIFEEEDWDTEAKIKMLNEQDAAFNNIPIEKLVELLK